MNRFTPLIALALVWFALASTAPAQDPAAVPRGGAFTLDGVRHEVPAAEIAERMRLIGRFDPALPPARVRELAWAAAIRIRMARALGLEVDPEAFARFMTERHAPVAARWTTPEGGVDRAALLEFVRSLGFEDVEAYEAFSREDFLAMAAIEHETPRPELDEDALRRRFEAETSVFVLTALTFAPETALEAEPPPPGDPAAMDAYRAWYARLNDAQKRLLDDGEHPALAADVLYVRFDERSPEELQRWLESRERADGRTIAEVIASWDPAPADLAKIYGRFVALRRLALARLNALAPEGADDESAFIAVQDAMIREWRVIRYVAEVWKELRAREGRVDMEAEARRTGLSFKRIPMTRFAEIVNDPDLRGDAVYPMRRLEPGEILDYTANTDVPASIYYFPGVVEQPGYHASIWQLDRFEDMRVREPEDVIERAWPVFLRALAWSRAQASLAAFGDAWRKAMTEAITRVESPTPADLVRIRTELFETMTADVENAEILAPIHVRPERAMAAGAGGAEVLGLRVQRFLESQWSRFRDGADGALEPGFVLPLTLDRDRLVGVLARIDRVVRPRPERFENDVVLRRHLEAAMRAELEARWAAAVEAGWTLESMRVRFGLELDDAEPAPR